MKTILKAMAHKVYEPAKKLNVLTGNPAYKLSLRMDLEYKAEKIARSKPNSFVDFSEIQEELFKRLPLNYYSKNEFPEKIRDIVLDDIHYSRDPKTGNEEGFIVTIKKINNKISTPGIEFNKAMEPFNDFITATVKEILENPEKLNELKLSKEEALALYEIFITLSNEGSMAVIISSREIQEKTFVSFDEPISNKVFKKVANLFKDLALE